MTCGFMVRAALLALVVYPLVMLGPAAALLYGIVPLARHGVGGLLAAVWLAFADFALLLLSAVLVTGLASMTLRLRYSGEHELDLRIPAVRNWLLNLVIYLPVAVALDLLHLYPLKSLHMRMFGAKVGKGAVMGGLVMDPALFEVGAGTIVGGFSVILGHAVERGRVKFRPVRVGRNCGVGTRSTIIAGAVIEDGAMLGAQSFLGKNAVVPAGATWGGVPAREMATETKE